jgi:Ala-tRNA(Pro) deacylase
MPARKLVEFLAKEHINYELITHPQAFTSQEVAASAHVSGKEMVKTVVLKLDGKLALAVLPACRNIDFSRLRKFSGAQEISMATEAEFKDRFPDCELGAMPPFGNLFDMNVLLDKSLLANSDIAFNAGTHRELIKLGFKDFESAVHPKVVEL